MQNILFQIIICLLAGMGAGIGTGFAGMSAAAVISPILITFLGIEAYQAVGIALASDVLASAVSAYTYGRNKKLDIKHGLIMMAAVLVFTVVGSYISKLVPNNTMGGISVVMTLFLGLKFLIFPDNKTNIEMSGGSKASKVIKAVVCGSIIGLICGFVGAGGGLMMLLILNSVLGYELKTAVGTSVFIMTFTALTGALAHFSLGGSPDWFVLLLCVFFTFLFARLAAVVANKLSNKAQCRITGVVLIVIEAAILFVNIWRMQH